MSYFEECVCFFYMGICVCDINLEMNNDYYCILVYFCVCDVEKVWQVIMEYNENMCRGFFFVFIVDGCVDLMF